MNTLSEVWPAVRETVARFHARMSLVRWTRGFRLLWSDLRMVREVLVETALPVELGSMTPASLLPQARGKS
jgi:hypothetical protein